MTDKKLVTDIKNVLDDWIKIIPVHLWDTEKLADTLAYQAQSFYVKEVELQPFATQFREIFPSVKLQTGKNFKSNLKDLQKKLLYFSKNYSYDPQVILEAARQYVQHAEQAGYKYIRTAAYFVFKLGEGSDLADWCERVINEEFQENQESIYKHV